MLFKEDTVARADAMAVRNNVGWYEWTHDLVEVRGKDARKLLDYICVNVISKAAPGVSKYTTMLNEEGKILDDTIVTCLDEEKFWVSTLYGPKFKPLIEKYQEGLDVEWEDLTNVIGMYAVQGPNSPAFLDSILETPIGDMKRFRMVNNKIDELSVKIHRSGFTGENGFEVYTTREKMPVLKEKLQKASPAFDARLLQTLEVYVRSLPMEKGMALKQDMQGLTPSEAGLGWSVHMEKDFHGKEALENYTDQYKLVGVILDDDRVSYEDICQNEPICYKGVQCGVVRQMIYGYTMDKNIGFAIVDLKHAEPGTVLTAGPNFARLTVAEDKKFLA